MGSGQQSDLLKLFIETLVEPKGTSQMRKRQLLYITLALGLLGQTTWGQEFVDIPTPRNLAPMELTGYWVSVITEDWRWRMITPPKGDYASIPLNKHGQDVANMWDPERDEGSCKAYGAPAVMRMPIRIHIYWENDWTLRIDTDHGMQNRFLYFEPEERDNGSTLQGYSRASWSGNPGGRFEFVIVRPELNHLEVRTTKLAPGYLRRNGIPYSEKTGLTEFFDRHNDFSEEWLTVTTIVNDPTYLTQEFITTSSFKKLYDDSDWRPTPCKE